jgi:queuosine precursor transporter
MWVVAYIASIVLVNWGFTVVPLVSLGDLGMWPPMSLVVGAVFVLRDYAQREVGHWVIPAMLIGGALSWWMASPAVAIASVSAFLISELADWAVYTFTRRPFRERVLYSSALGTPIDSAVCLALI